MPDARCLRVTLCSVFSVACSLSLEVRGGMLHLWHEVGTQHISNLDIQVRHAQLKYVTSRFLHGDWFIRVSSRCVSQGCSCSCTVTYDIFIMLAFFFFSLINQGYLEGKVIYSPFVISLDDSTLIFIMRSFHFPGIHQVALCCEGYVSRD